MKTPKQTVSHARAHANTSETVVSDPMFRAANAAPYLSEEGRITSPEVIQHIDARKAAESIIFNSYVNQPHAPEEKRNWEAKRLAALFKLGGGALGTFDSYFANKQSEEEAPDGDIFPVGNPLVVETNSSIVGLKNSIEDPMEFFEASLDRIKRRKTQSVGTVGPENYASALKFFTDKFVALGMHDLDSEDKKKITARLDECLAGFFDIAQKDKPNAFEMTNIFYAVKILPYGSVSERFVKPLLEQTLDYLPEASEPSMKSLIGMIPKLDTSKYGEAAAEVMTLVFEKGKQFSTTKDFRDSLRALAVLPRGKATEQAVRSFLVSRNNLEQSLDLWSAEEVMRRIRSLADNAINSDDLFNELKQLGESVARTASADAKRAHLSGEYTEDQWKAAQASFQRIMVDYKAI